MPGIHPTRWLVFLVCGSLFALGCLTDNQEGGAIAYLWTGTGGSIADPNAASTTYTCGEVGEHAITITVSDDDFEFCTDDLSVPVTCVED